MDHVMGILVSFPLGACTSHHTGGGLVSPTDTIREVLHLVTMASIAWTGGMGLFGITSVLNPFEPPVDRWQMVTSGVKDLPVCLLCRMWSHCSGYSIVDWFL